MTTDNPCDAKAPAERPRPERLPQPAGRSRIPPRGLYARLIAPLMRDYRFDLHGDHLNVNCKRCHRSWSLHAGDGPTILELADLVDHALKHARSPHW